MTRLLYGLACLVVLAGGSMPANGIDSAPVHFRVSGIVHSARDGGALPHAHLRAELAGEGTSSAGSIEAFSDEQGRFDLALTGPGRWQISGSARGFFLQGYEQHDQFESDVVLSRETPQMTIDLRLQPDSAIAGFVLDEAGEPVRGAQVTLFPAPVSDTDLADQPRGPMQTRLTDDRGHYELGGLAPAAYRVSVNAQPWYAAAGRMQRTGSTQTDSVLDMVYPATWYPAATDAEAAEVLTLRPGESREADFSLIAIPATHLRVALSRTPRSGADAERRPMSGLPQLDRISGYGPVSTPPMLVFDGAGQAEISGLAPGLYRVRFPAHGGGESTMFLRISPGAQRQIDLSTAVPGVPITFVVNGLDDGARAQVTLTDLASGSRFEFTPPSRDTELSPPEASSRRRFGGRGGTSHTLDVPPGRYRVAVSRAGAAYLAGISASGADVHGNLLDLRGSAATVTLQMETAPATLSGVCTLHGQPLSGAMVLLVPASLGQAGSIPVVRRDQTNSDGSYDLRDVTPGQYILVAIDHGWGVNWRDPSTMERYLLHGVALSPARASRLRQNLEAQAP